MTRITEQNFQAKFDKAFNYIKASNFEEAAPLLEALIRFKPDHASLYVNRGLVRLRAQRTLEAIEDFTQAIGLLPDDPIAYYNRASVYHINKAYEAALADLRRIHEIDPAFDPDIPLKLADQLGKLNRHEEALEVLAPYLAERPDHLEALNRQGASLMALERFDELLAVADHVVALQPQHPAAYLNKAMAQHRLEQSEAGVATLDTALSLKPDYADAYVLRAVLYEDLGRSASALRDYERAHALGHPHAAPRIKALKPTVPRKIVRRKA